MNTKIKISELRTLDIAELLDTDDDIIDFLESIFADGTQTEIASAISIAERAYDRLAKKDPSSLSSPDQDGSPSFETLMRVFNALGLRLSLKRIESAQAA